MSRREDLKRIAELMAQMNGEQLLIARAMLLIRVARRWVAVQGATLVDRMARAIVIGESDHDQKNRR